MSERTCDGKCCAVFPLRAGAQERLAAGANGPVDGPFILDMLIPLTRDEALERAERYGSTLPAPVEESGWEHSLFTCRHWDEDTRLCTVYEQRPDMCREYPYENECSHGCDYCQPPDVRAFHRVSREYWATKNAEKVELALIIGLGVRKRVVAHATRRRTGFTRCGLSLANARNVTRTPSISFCHNCRRSRDD